MTKIIQFEDQGGRVFKNWVCGSCRIDCRCTRLARRVEVFVPTFNHSRYISAALRSVLMQTLNPKDFCILVHIDGSTDDTLEIVLETLNQSTASFTILAKDENSYSRSGFFFFTDLVNTCRSQYMAFLDGDDQWTCREKLSLQLSALDSNLNSGICHTAYRVRNTISDKVSLQPDTSLSEVELESPTLLLKENYVGTLTVVIRVSAVAGQLDVHAFSSIAVGDFPIWLTIAINRNLGIVFLNIETAEYRVHGANFWATPNRLALFMRSRRLEVSLANVLQLPIGRRIPAHLFSISLRRFSLLWRSPRLVQECSSLESF